MEQNKYIDNLKALLENVNPVTGEVLDEESPLNNKDIKETLKLALKCIGNIEGETENSGSPWTDKEEKELVNDLKSNLSLYAISRKHGRSLNAIDSRIGRLFKKGLLKLDDVEHRNNI